MKYVQTALLAIAISVSGCGLFTKGNAKTAFDAAQMACAFAQAEGVTSAAVLDACKIDQALAPAIDQLLSEKRKLAAARCPSK